ncbi:MAG: HypC/HybG/HupF family hydrogenase formation chaperone [Deltaproteobacteria bacterium]|jgi:hydrogenase expression/formation protein HypC|nr:MAG: HypC/HybG/HupF family hydrogenase formation chaperone [Deltaproteobacteria bacterium]
MCLGVPALVEEVIGEMGTVSIGEAKIEVSLVLVDDVSTGDYVLVHAGFAIARVDEEEAVETLSLIKEMIPDEVY